MASRESLEIARKSRELFERSLRALLEQSHWGSFVSIEPESGDYFVGRTLDEAIAAARKAHPKRVSYTLRVGHPTAVEIGCCP
jgi:hypothetical protein